MKKTSVVLSKIAYIIGALILLTLAMSAFHYSFYMNLYYYEGISFIAEGPDSRVKNLIMIVLAFLALFLFSKLFFIKCKSDEGKFKRLFIVAGGFSVLLLSGLIFFVCKTRFAIECDQYEVFSRALQFAAKDYSPVADYYLQMYPQQLGLAFFESFFLRFTSDHLIFQIINAVFISASVLLIPLLSKELFNKPEISLFSWSLIVVNFPLYYLVSFVYGDIFMIFSSLFISYLAVLWIKKSKWIYFVLMIVDAMIMIPIRKNSIIFLLALAITLLVVSLYNKKLLPIVLAATILVVPLLFNSLIVKGYEKKGNTTIDNEMPAINWVAMGLYDAVNPGYSVGVYNMFNELTYFGAGSNKEASKAAAMEFINKRINEFKEDPSRGYQFFRFKTLEQWTEPTFSSIDSTVGLHKYCWEEVKFTYDFHTLDTMSRIMNYVQSVVYFFALVYVVILVITERKPEQLLLPVAFIGGFLFSIIWEASGRYVYPYFIMLIPLAAAGMGRAGELVAILLGKLKPKKQTSESLSE